MKKKRFLAFIIFALAAAALGQQPNRRLVILHSELGEVVTAEQKWISR